MSRLRLGSALVAAVILALGLLGPAAAHTQHESKYGGTLVVGLIAPDPGSLDPTFLGGSLGVYEVAKSFCEQLYDYDRRARIVPQLAAALPTISKDKLTYTIPLRRGIVFNDGTPFNAEAVVESLRRVIDLPGSPRANRLAAIDSVTASGPYEVAIHLKTRFTPLPDTLASIVGAVMSPTQLAKLGDNFASNPVCVGPFMFDHRVAGDNVTVIKSPYYYDRGNVYLDKIVFKPIPDGPAATAALKAGDIQVLDSVPTTELDGVEGMSSLRTQQTKGLGWRGIVINVGNRNGVRNLPYSKLDTPLASSPALRQAFEQAIDRDALNRVVYGGTTQIGCTPVSPSSETFDATIRCTPYDPANAKKLVARSGFPNPTVHLLVQATTEQLRVAEFIQAQEKAVGINVVIDARAPAGPYWTSGNFDTALSGPAIGASTDGSIFEWFGTSGTSNFGGYSSPRLDQILANSRKATSPAALKTLYHAAEQILANDRPAIILYHSVPFAGVSADVAGVETRSADLLLRVAFARRR